MSVSLAGRASGYGVPAGPVSLAAMGVSGKYIPSGLDRDVVKNRYPTNIKLSETAASGTYAPIPGGKNVLQGNIDTVAYFGEVAPASFTAYASVASDAGITQGTAINAATPWLKFAYHGRLIFVPKQNVRRNISWNHINARGAVYPVDTGNGVTPGRNQTGSSGISEGGPVAQTRKVTQANLVWDLRLLTGSAKDPSSTDDQPSGPYEPNPNGGEWFELFVPLQDGTWGSLSNADLGTGGRFAGNNNAFWCQESAGFYSWGSTFGPQRTLRGFQDGPNTTDISTSNQTVMNGKSYYNWRPVLDLLLE